MTVTKKPRPSARSLERRNATRETGLERIQAAVPDCFSPTMRPWMKIIAPREANMPVNKLKTTKPSKRASPGSAKRTIASMPLATNSHIKACTIHVRVPHQPRSSLRSRLENPLRQPLSCTGRRVVALTLIALASFNHAHEHLFEVLLLASEVRDAHVAPGHHQLQQTFFRDGLVGHAHLPRRRSVPGENVHRRHPRLARHPGARVFRVALQGQRVDHGSGSGQKLLDRGLRDQLAVLEDGYRVADP